MCITGAINGAWRRSSYSIPFNDCVEVLINKEGVHVRDSKHKQVAGLRFAAQPWTQFLGSTRSL